MAVFFSKKRPSLLLDFILLSIITVSIFSFLFFWLILQNAEDQSNIIIQKLDAKGDKLSRTFTDIIDFTAHEMVHIGRQIQKNYEDTSHINSILESFKSQPDDVVSWSTFMWTDTTHKIIVTNNLGVISGQKSLADRDYIPKTITDPWSIYTGIPVFGATSGKWAIPAGVGITNKKGKYIGTLATGLIINKLIFKLENTIQTDELSFSILDKNLNMVAQSSNNEQITKDNGTFFEIANNNFESTQGLITAKHNIFRGYAYYHKIKDYPYIIVTSYNKNISDTFLKNNILFGLGEIILIISVLLGTLFFMYKRIIKPMVKLSHSADQISKGNYSVKIPRGGPSEIYALAKQLVNVQRYIKKIHRIDQQLMKAKNAAEEANAAKSQFLASMSHELRTPLNSILGYSEMITHEVMGKIENKTYIEYAGYAHSSGQMLLALINDILDISKAEAGHFSIYETEFSIRKVIDESMEILSQQALAANVHIELMLPERMPTLLADEIRIKQVILNIMSNAIKFSHKGGKVEMKVDVSNSGFNLTVRDYGIGISEEYLGKVLDKFGQANQAMQRRRNEGSGLGLWLTKILLESHQGTITLESTVGKGTTIFVHLPVERVKKY